MLFGMAEHLDLPKLKERREKLGLTMQQAADAAGLESRQHWYMIESGRKANVTLETLAKLAEALRCKSRDLLK
jgi:transcriptional regulator with XRE-family HTH domain